MTPLPATLGGGPLIGWRLDAADRADRWDVGDGPAANGGRWNVPGIAAIYASLDPATAILEIAINAGLDAVRRTPQVLTSFTIGAPEAVHVVRPDDVPNGDWLACETPNEEGQRWGANLLEAHRFVLIPSACSPRSWNIMFDRHRAEGFYTLLGQERLKL